MTTRIGFMLCITFFISSGLSAQLTVKVSNSLDFKRSEVVSIPAKRLGRLCNKKEDIRIRKKGSGLNLPLQWIDMDGNGIPEELLFMAGVEAKGTETYTVILDGRQPVPIPEKRSFSRFVPERTDDYAWENDKVAFRTYGTDAQQRFEQHRPDGTLSSGIDIWLKRTPNLILDKWYGAAVKDPGYYHTDHGEGYDPYHVGLSRGNGGTGLWKRDSLYVSKNFTHYKTISTGPLRTVFELDYAPYGDIGLTEKKIVSLDAGSSFSKFTVQLQSEGRIENYTVGITLHDKSGTTNINLKKGWFRHAETIDGNLVTEGIVLDPRLVKDAWVRKTKTADQSHLLIGIIPGQKELTYYAGFAWDKSGAISTTADWEALLEQQSAIAANPLKVTVGNR